MERDQATKFINDLLRLMVGRNGSDLFITGDFPPSAGRVLLFGEDVTALPAFERVRRGLRRTYQTSLLFKDLTVRDNLFLAVRGVAQGRLSLLRPRADSHAMASVNALLILSTNTGEPGGALPCGETWCR